jgi:hypothetical protein
VTRLALAFPILLAATALAGCTVGGGGDGDSGSGSRITSVAITSSPVRADPGATVTVCWQVDGRGTIPHTAAHWDTQSHGDDATFNDYDGGASYPGNGTSPAPGGYELPATFCTGLPMSATGNLYWRGHALIPDDQPGELSDEGVVKPAGLAAKPTVDDHENFYDAGSLVEICWHVGGTGNVAHTALHWDTESHPLATSFTEYQGGAVYPDDEDAADPMGYDLPGSFCGHLTIPGSGTLYFQAHVIDRLGAPGKLSGEDSVTVR